MAERFSYIIGGVEYTLVDGGHTFFLGEEGFGLEGLTVEEMSVPFEDGAKEIGTYLPPRKMSLVIGFMHTSASLLKAFEDQYRHNLRPSRGTGVLRRVTDDGRTRDIVCRVTHFPKSSGGRRGPLRVDRAISFRASNPYFFDPVQQVKSFALASPGGAAFPAAFADPGGWEFSESTVDSHVLVNNVGDIPSWPEILVNGPGRNPEITNETSSKVFKLTATGDLILDTGDWVRINMQEGTIQLHDESEGTTVNIIERMTDDSEFWPLLQGENQVHVTMADVTTGSIILSYYLWYDHV
jgi:hypothetical protein